MTNQTQMFGCTIDELRTAVGNAMSGPAMVAMSMLSDSQELIERGDANLARQAINRAKWIISEYLSERPVAVYESDENLERIVQARTGFKSFADLLNAAGNYAPTIRCTRESNRRAGAIELAELKFLADRYDAAQAARGDKRRAFRG